MWHRHIWFFVVENSTFVPVSTHYTWGQQVASLPVFLYRISISFGYNCLATSSFVQCVCTAVAHLCKPVNIVHKFKISEIQIFPFYGRYRNIFIRFPEHFFSNLHQCALVGGWQAMLTRHGNNECFFSDLTKILFYLIFLVAAIQSGG